MLSNLTQWLIFKTVASDMNSNTMPVTHTQLFVPDWDLMARFKGMWACYQWASRSQGKHPVRPDGSIMQFHMERQSMHAQKGSIETLANASVDS